MPKYITFLRGINVGNIRIKMADLKSAFETMDCKEVKTFLQTGNVVFESEKSLSDLKPIIEKGLTTTFKYEAYILLYAYESLTDVIAQYPFEMEENYHAYVIFVDKKSVIEELVELSKTIGDESKFIAEGHQVLYWKVKIGDTLGTPFAKILAKAKYKSCVTTRNFNTLNLML
jgi:uncharacterized protein (DUF1697 family)